MSVRVYAVFDSKTAADLAAMQVRRALPQAGIRTWQNGRAEGKSPLDLPYWAVNNAGGPTGTPNYYAPYPAAPLDLRSAAPNAAGRERPGGGALCAQVRNHEEAALAARLLREKGGSGVRRD